MPVTDEVVSEFVWRVPKATSVSSRASKESGETCSSRETISGFGGRSPPAAPAGAE
jgi:hypothetical protein